MIGSGELDCVIIARPPDSFREKHPDVVRLFPDYETLEQRYYEETHASIRARVPPDIARCAYARRSG